MFTRLINRVSGAGGGAAPVQVIESARQWQRWLRILAWLVPIVICVGAYLFIWYQTGQSEQSLEDVRLSSNIVFASSLAALILGILLYQVQIVLSRQVDTSAELERLVAERTRHITEVMEKLDEQNQALRALDHQKSEFVTLVSHELRAPLTNINGGLELMLGRDGELTEKTRETLQLVAAEAGRLTRFVETILNVSAIESGQLPARLGPVPVAGIVRHVVGQFGNLPASRLVVAVSTDLPPAYTDEHFMQSVLFHLLDNALKYAPDGAIWVAALVHNESIEIRVTDSGPGVSPEAASRLFTMFERLNARDSQFVYGYGLGLYMCKRLLQALNGNIWLDSEVQPGATFVVQIPIWVDDPQIA